MEKEGDHMPRLTSEIGQDGIYYYDNRENCKVELPRIDVHAILNAELLNYQGDKHCDLIFRVFALSCGFMGKAVNSRT